MFIIIIIIQMSATIESNFVQMLVLRQVIENKGVYMSSAEGKDLLAVMLKFLGDEYTVDTIVHSNPWISTLGEFTFFVFATALIAEIERVMKQLEAFYKTVDYKIMIDGSVYYYLDTNGVSLRDFSIVNGPQRV
jgi:hypothetical protein